MSLTEEDKLRIRIELGRFGTELEGIETKLERVEMTLLSEFNDGPLLSKFANELTPLR